MANSSEQTSPHEFRGLSIDGLNPARVAMLKFDLTAKMDSIVFASPIDRCLIIAESIGKSAKENPDYGDLVRESGVMLRLRDTAINRKTDPSAGVPPLIPVPVSKPREELDV